MVCFYTRYNYHYGVASKMKKPYAAHRAFLFLLSQPRKLTLGHFPDIRKMFLSEIYIILSRDLFFGGLL